jgi:hypothetical protein
MLFGPVEGEDANGSGQVEGGLHPKDATLKSVSDIISSWKSGHEHLPNLMGCGS